MESKIELVKQSGRPDTLSYDMIEKMYTELLVEKSTIRNLVKNYPNDMDLGKKVRALLDSK
jgi:hypothetical protein